MFSDIFIHELFILFSTFTLIFKFLMALFKNKELDAMMKSTMSNLTVSLILELIYIDRTLLEDHIDWISDYFLNIIH